jgi:hypothetical protein
MSDQEVPLLEKDGPKPQLPAEPIIQRRAIHSYKRYTKPFLLGLTALIISLILHLHVSRSSIQHVAGDLGDRGMCPGTDAIPVKSPRTSEFPSHIQKAKGRGKRGRERGKTSMLMRFWDGVDVWKNLSVKEAVDVREWLFAPERGLNLTKSDEADDR